MTVGSLRILSLRGSPGAAESHRPLRLVETLPELALCPRKPLTSREVRMTGQTSVSTFVKRRKNRIVGKVFHLDESTARQHFVCGDSG